MRTWARFSGQIAGRALFAAAIRFLILHHHQPNDVESRNHRFHRLNPRFPPSATISNHPKCQSLRPCTRWRCSRPSSWPEWRSSCIVATPESAFPLSSYSSAALRLARILSIDLSLPICSHTAGNRTGCAPRDQPLIAASRVNCPAG